jgi:hypothetical protein
MQKPMFSDDEEQRPRLTKEELRDACFHSAATIVVAFALGCEFEDCRLDDDGRQWPVSISIVELKYPPEWCGKEAFTSIAMIHEAGAMAVAKSHGRSPHRVRESEENLFNSLVRDTSATTAASGAINHFHNPLFLAATRTSRTAMLLDHPLIWKVIEALAQFIRTEEAWENCYGALGTDGCEPGEDSAALELITGMGLTPGWALSEGRIVPPKPQIVQPSGGKDSP